MSVYARFGGKKISSKDPNYKRGKWYMRRMINGRLIHKPLPFCPTATTTKAQAQAAEIAEIRKLFNRHYNFTDAPGFSEFASTVYWRYVQAHNVNTTAKRIYLQYLSQWFKDTKLDEITPQDCRDCQQWLKTHKGSKHGLLAPATVNRIMSTLQKMFRLACEEGILDRNPMTYVKQLKEPAPRRRLLTPEEADRFWQEVEKDRYLWRIVVLAVNLPIRRGQLLAIKVSDVDLENDTVKVIGSKRQPERVIPLNQTAKAVLMELIAFRESEWLFSYPPDGVDYETRKGMPVGDFHGRWNRMLKRAGIRNFHFHDLRAHQATELLNRGVSLDIVQELFAHSSADITRVYAKTEMDRVRAAIGKLDAQKA